MLIFLKIKGEKQSRKECINIPPLYLSGESVLILERESQFLSKKFQGWRKTTYWTMLFWRRCVQRVVLSLFSLPTFSYPKSELLLITCPTGRRCPMQTGFWYLARCKIRNKDRAVDINHSIKGDLNNELLAFYGTDTLK